MPLGKLFAKKKATYTGRSQAQAMALAAANGWDVVVPNDNELLLDFDDDESYQRFLSLTSSFESNIAGIHAIMVSVSKSGDPTRRHVYITLDRNVSSLDRITFQLILQSDPVRELLSWARYEDGEQYPTLFFELPGTALGGRVLQHGVTQVSYASVVPPVSAQNVPLGIDWSDPPDPVPVVSDADRYPHKCDRCGGPAYNGLFNSDCKAGCK